MMLSSFTYFYSETEEFKDNSISTNFAKFNYGKISNDSYIPNILNINKRNLIDYQSNYYSIYSYVGNYMVRSFSIEGNYSPSNDFSYENFKKIYKPTYIDFGFTSNSNHSGYVEIRGINNRTLVIVQNNRLVYSKDLLPKNAHFYIHIDIEKSNSTYEVNYFIQINYKLIITKSINTTSLEKIKFWFGVYGTYFKDIGDVTLTKVSETYYNGQIELSSIENINSIPLILAVTSIIILLLGVRKR